MQKIIDGKLYDTETAFPVCDISTRGYQRTDLAWEDTRLYQTAKGTFFIAGEGGARSRWAQSVGNSGVAGGSGITIISETDARSLVEQHGDAHDYERIFGTPEEG